MKNPFIIGFIAILVLALILASRAFVFVFTMVLHYGIIALVIAVLIWAAFWIRNKTKGDGK